MNEKLKEKVLKIVEANEKLSRMVQRFNKLAEGEIVLADTYTCLMVESGIEKFAELMGAEIEENEIAFSDNFDVGKVNVFQMKENF